jgi:hypothetical protein
MEPTITQNNALYLIQHGLSKRRANFLRRMRITSRNDSDDTRRIFLSFIPTLHRDDRR